MKHGKSKETTQETTYNFLTTCSSDELENWFIAYRGGYPKCVAPMVKAIADLRGFDTSSWQKFCF